MEPSVDVVAIKMIILPKGITKDSLKLTGRIELLERLDQFISIVSIVAIGRIVCKSLIYFQS